MQFFIILEFTCFSSKAFGKQSDTRSNNVSTNTPSRCDIVDKTAMKIFQDFNTERFNSCRESTDCVYIGNHPFGMDLNKDKVVEPIAFMAGLRSEVNRYFTCLERQELIVPPVDYLPPKYYECIKNRCVGRERSQDHRKIWRKYQMPREDVLENKEYLDYIRKYKKVYKKDFDEL
ncbi:MAG: hypothetical protein ACOH5I_26665 [Oligoflexus sp.]